MRNPERDRLSPSPRRVLYIGGWGRSGSTLLARLLGERPDMLFVGELRDLWHRGVVEDRVCGCGVPFTGCEFWSAVGAAAFGGWDQLPADEMTRLRARVDKPWWVPLYRRDALPPAIRGDVDRYVDILTRVLDAMHAVSGARTIIDSSKIPSFALLLGRIPRIDLRVAHLVRDPRGSVYSWQKSVVRTDASDGQRNYMLQYSPWSASMRYLVYNRQADGLRSDGFPYTRLRYEDLVSSPVKTLDRLVESLGLEGWDVGQVRDGQIRLGLSHSVVGNPMRMNTGWVDLQPDTAWHHELSRGTGYVVSGITSPALSRYGYPLGRP